MSITWISFTSDIVVDLLVILGCMLGVPIQILGLTLLAWGNCLGDMSANVTMTKKGFGEMAMTGCMAGPIFNMLIGLGLSTLISLLNDHKGKAASIPFSMYKEDLMGTQISREFNLGSVIPIGLLSSQLFVLAIILMSVIKNNY